MDLELIQGRYVGSTYWAYISDEVPHTPSVVTNDYIVLTLGSLLLRSMN